MNLPILHHAADTALATAPAHPWGSDLLLTTADDLEAIAAEAAAEGHHSIAMRIKAAVLRLVEAAPRHAARPPRCAPVARCQRGALRAALHHEQVWRHLLRIYGAEAETIRRTLDTLTQDEAWRFLPPQAVALVMVNAGFDARHVAAIEQAIEGTPIVRRARYAPEVLAVLAQARESMDWGLPA